MQAPPFTLIAAAIATLACGCTGNSHARQDSAQEVGTSIREVRTEVASAKVQIEEANASLDGLISTSDDATLPRRYQLFSQSVDDLEEQREALSERADDMLERREDYLDEWRSGMESIDDPELRQVARERREKLSEQFGEIRQRLVEAGYAMDPMIDRLNNIEATLKYDLSRQSVDHVAKTIEDDDLAEEKVDKALSEIQKQLDELDRITDLR